MEHINTLKYYKKLVAGGVPEEQAEVQTHSLNSAFDHLATKEDLNRVIDDLKDVKSDVREIKGDIRKFMWGGLLALAGGTVKVLFFH